MKKICWLSSAFPFKLYHWIRIRNPDRHHLIQGMQLSGRDGKIISLLVFNIFVPTLDLATDLRYPILGYPNDLLVCRPIVLIFDGNLEIGGQVWSYFGYVICYGICLERERSECIFFFSEKTYFPLKVRKMF